MIGFDERAQLPLTERRKLLVAAGVAMFLGQIAAAAGLAPQTTGEGHANEVALIFMGIASVAWSAAAVLCLVRQADLPDIATASFLVTIGAYAAFVFSASIAARGTRAETDLVDALFLGVTSGALVALVVWALALSVARLLRLPTTDGMHDER